MTKEQIIAFLKEQREHLDHEAYYEEAEHVQYFLDVIEGRIPYELGAQALTA